jgi:hypothetical protein
MMGVLALTLGQPAFACSRAPGTPEPTESELFDRAATVFVARLKKVEEVPTSKLSSSSNWPNVEATFTLIEVLKGTPPKDGKVVSWAYGPGNCSLPFLAAADYLFFLESGRNLVTLFSGSVMFWDATEKAAQDEIEKFRRMKN